MGADTTKAKLSQGITKMQHGVGRGLATDTQRRIASLDASAREFYQLCADEAGKDLAEWLESQPF